MAELNNSSSSASTELPEAPINISTPAEESDEKLSLPSNESVVGSDDSDDDSDDDKSDDSEDAASQKSAAAEEKQKPKSSAPRRSKRSNFGNRYEQAIEKEKEDGLKPQGLRNGNLLALSASTSKAWSADDDDSEEEDAEFKPEKLQNGSKDSDHSQSSSGSSSSDSDDDDSKAAPAGGAPPGESAKAKKKKDPLYAAIDQKRSLEELIEEVATSSNLEGIRICAICLWDECDVENDAVVQCDSCGVTVHEACYGVLGKELEEVHAKDKDSDSVSSTETMPWFCDPCRFGERSPLCMACPNKFGAFKQTVKGDWIHCTCARYIKEVYFQDEQHMGDVVVSDLPHSRWGDHPCVVCEDIYEKNAGVTIHCETGMCRKYLHATCAMLVGSFAEVEEELGYPLAIYCPDHIPKEDRAGNRRCYLASLGLQRRYQRELQTLGEEERERLSVAEEKQRQMYLQHRTDRGFVCELKHSVRPLHSAYSLLMAGHARSSALGDQPRPAVNANPPLDSLHSSKPDFRPEFVAYVYKRENLIRDYLERMAVAKRERHDSVSSRPDQSRKVEVKRLHAQLNVARESLHGLLAPFMVHMEKKYLPKRAMSPTRRTVRPPGGGGGGGRSSAEPDTSPRLSRLLSASEPVCNICRSSSFPQRMVQCADCKERFHLKCLDPPLLTMPNAKSKGVKWLCSDCAPTEEDSDAESSTDGGLEGRKRRTLQGKHPLRAKRDALPPPKASSPKKRGRKLGFRPPKKVKLDVATPPVRVGEGAGAPGKVEPISANATKTARTPGGRRARVVEEKTGVCVKCKIECGNKNAVECDRCAGWYHFLTCLEPSCAKSPRTRFYGWLCEDCSSPGNEEAVFERSSS